MNFKEFIEKYLPNEIIERLKTTEQNKKWHPEIYVYNHLENIYNNIEEYFQGDFDLKLCAVFHDLGKLDTTFLNKKGELSSYGHENLAEKYIDKYLSNEYNIDKIKQICSTHMKAHLYRSGELKDLNKRKDFENLQYFDDIMKFEFCDNKN